MDEVEAALDDANLGRLLTIFEDLRANSQLIVITHQKRTMEIADALYGVSMRAGRRQCRRRPARRQGVRARELTSGAPGWLEIMLAPPTPPQEYLAAHGSLRRRPRGCSR